MGVAPERGAISAAPLDRLLKAQAELRDELQTNPDPALWGETLLTGLPWQPVTDGSVVPERPLDRIRRGAAADVDLMVGSNSDENRLFLVTAGAVDQIPSEAVAGTLAGYGIDPDRALIAYRAMYPNASPGDLMAAIQTDWYWRIPGLRIADAHAATARNAATYMYDFAWRGSPQFGGRLGAGHSMEIPFVFDTLGNGTEALHGPHPPQALADSMHRAWVSFATSGDPGWPRYDLARRATMRFDTSSQVVNDPLAQERTLWEGVR
jgi:carboxylesterase 2/para-nitrobenzyl esterase